jgi:hypothetical protein
MNDFDDSTGKAWISLIANIKYFLVAYPKKREELVKAFIENGINIPLLDYSQVVMESTYLERLSDWVRHRWVARSISGLTVGMLVRSALEARTTYQNGMKSLLAPNPNVTGFERKRLIPKLRFFAGRLIYLSALDELSEIVSGLTNYPELNLQTQVMTAIQLRDVSSLLKFGSNAVQAASQVLHIQKEPVTCSLKEFNNAELQGLAILRLNGVQIDLSNNNGVDSSLDDPLNQFALGLNIAELMKSKDLFIRELASLYGLDGASRYMGILDTAFDRDEHLMFDIINQLQDSSYF